MKTLEEIMQHKKLSAKRESKFWVGLTLLSLSGAITGHLLDNTFIAGSSGCMTAYSSIFVLGSYLTYRSYKKKGEK